MPAHVDTGETAFAAGHLGEFTQVITPSLVDEVLAKTGRVQVRVRKLPARVVVYFVLAMALFGECGYRGVWAALVAAPGMPDVDPSAAALRQARRRLGSEPLSVLFDQVKGAVAAEDAVGSWWKGLRTVAWDSTGILVADSEANRSYCGRASGRNGVCGFPMIRLSALVECGTRALIDAVLGPWPQAEEAQCTVLCRALRPGMLVLADRGSKGFALVRSAAVTGAQLLWRMSADLQPPVLHALPDGTYLSMSTGTNERDRLRRWSRHKRTAPPQIAGVAIRVIEAAVAVRAADGTMTTTSLRLFTTLLDHHRYPAAELAELYHRRWQAETAYSGLKVTLRGPDRVLRSQHTDDALQELLGLLVVYQVARQIAVDAATHAGVDPSRIALAVTIRTARHTVITATGTTTRHGCQPTPGIRQAILHPRELAPRHRPTRILPRRVKRPISTFAYNATRKNTPLTNATIAISITTATDRTRRWRT
ncbi:IS4 family transposase [Streptomyces justiciae]|uniref:IS4 family transposase n=1 Tax=Streptomyces justiciae TaxID=2780140 RepID=UPI00211954FF|nr:IS4 family transposase [Streptomyces justiciae]MCW8382400.1 IS4 family transposase [Streptomyces justiciae]